MNWQAIDKFDPAKAKRDKGLVLFTKGAGHRIFCANYRDNNDPFEPGPWRYFCEVSIPDLPEPGWSDQMQSMLSEITGIVRLNDYEFTQEVADKLEEWFPKAAKVWEARKDAKGK